MFTVSKPGAPTKTFLIIFVSAAMILAPIRSSHANLPGEPIPPEMRDTIEGMIGATGFCQRVIYNSFQPDSTANFVNIPLSQESWEETLETPEQQMRLDINKNVYNHQVDNIFFDLTVENASSGDVTITIVDPRNEDFIYLRSIAPGFTEAAQTIHVDYSEDPALPTMVYGLVGDITSELILTVTSNSGGATAGSTAGSTVLFDGIIGDLLSLNSLRAQNLLLTVGSIEQALELVSLGELTFSYVRIGNSTTTPLSFHIDQGFVRHDMPALGLNEVTEYLRLTEQELTTQFLAASWTWAVALVVVFALVTCAGPKNRVARVLDQQDAYNTASDLKLRGLSVTLVFHGENPAQGTVFVYPDCTLEVPALTTIGYSLLTFLLFAAMAAAILLRRRSHGIS